MEWNCQAWTHISRNCQQHIVIPRKPAAKLRHAPQIDYDSPFNFSTSIASSQHLYHSYHRFLSLVSFNASAFLKVASGQLDIRAGMSILCYYFSKCPWLCKVSISQMNNLIRLKLLDACKLKQAESSGKLHCLKGAIRQLHLECISF